MNPREGTLENLTRGGFVLDDKAPTSDDIREHARMRHITFVEAWKELCGGYLEKNRMERRRKMEKIFKDGNRNT